MSLHFEDPLLLLLLVPLAAAAVWSLAVGRGARSSGGGVIVPSLALVSGLAPTWRLRLRWLPAVLRWTAAALLVIALARPQSGRAGAVVPAEGIDIVLALDVSSSMEQALLGQESRLQVAKRVLADFVRGRENDRLALVVFRSQSLVLSPLTLDYNALTKLVEGAPGVPIPDGTAIGLAVADSLNLLRDSQARSRAIILLTDGENNRFEVEPLAAARIAQALKMRLYAIGIVPQEEPGQPFLSPNVDEEALSRMAELTGGVYQRATSPEALATIYRDIGELEKSRVGREHFAAFHERASYFLVPALALLALQVLLAATLFRRLP